MKKILILVLSFLILACSGAFVGFEKKLDLNVKDVEFEPLSVFTSALDIITGSTNSKDNIPEMNISAVLAVNNKNGFDITISGVNYVIYTDNIILATGTAVLDNEIVVKAERVTEIPFNMILNLNNTGETVKKLIKSGKADIKLRGSAKLKAGLISAEPTFKSVKKLRIFGK